MTDLRLRRAPAAPLIALLITLVTAAALLLSAGAPAAAHSVLIGTSPSDGDELDAAPEEVSLTFNEDLVDLGTEVVVTGPDGQEASTGETDVTGPVASRPLASDLAAGDYEVTWRVTSADGHPISGTFAFTVSGDASGAEEPAPTDETGETPQATPESTETTEPAEPAETHESDATDEAAPIIGWLLAGGVVLIAVVIGGLLLANRRKNRDS